MIRRERDRKSVCASDLDLLRRMLNSVHAGKAPKGILVHDLAEAIRELRQRVRWHDTPGARSEERVCFRSRFAAPHVEQRARRKGAERHSCPRPGGSDTGTAPARALA